MAEGFRLRWLFIEGEPKEVFGSIKKPLAEANTGGMRKLSTVIKNSARQHIRQTMSGRWANALRVDLYPKRRVSLEPAIWIWHRIPYAGIFEEGGTVSGSPLLWLPLPSMPRKIGGKRTSVASYTAQGGKLVRVDRAGAAPLLIGRPPSGMRRGRTKAQRSAFNRFSGSQAAPLFIGVSAVKIKKRFHLHQLFEREADSLPAYIEQAQKDEA